MEMSRRCRWSAGRKTGTVEAFKFATLSIIGQNIPLILAVEPVRESSEWDENPSNQIHRTVRRLVRRAKEHVPIETVLCDREFDSIQVFQTLSNLDVNYLIPKRVSSSERDVLEQMGNDPGADGPMKLNRSIAPDLLVSAPSSLYWCGSSSGEAVSPPVSMELY